MKNFLYSIILFLILFSCQIKKESNISDNFKEINIADSTLFLKPTEINDTINFKKMDSIFGKYKCTYLDNNKLVHKDFTLENLSEYDIFPNYIMKNRHNVWYKIGKFNIDKKHYGILTKLYDIYSSRFFLLVFDKKNNHFKSSIGLFGYFASTNLQ